MRFCEADAISPFMRLILFVMTPGVSSFEPTSERTVKSRAKSATLVLSGRNLGTPWTKYPGIDPEANSSVGNTGGGNNDFFSPPTLRYWIVRFNLGI